MWYECLPPMIIVGVAMYIPQFLSFQLNKLMFDNPYKRRLGTIWDSTMFDRDGRIAGNAWTVPGLENIPDE